MRPKTKDDAQKLTLTLSAPAREFLMNEAMRRGVSRTQVVEDMVLTHSEKNHSLLGKTTSQPHAGENAKNIHRPSAGGSKTRPIRYQTAQVTARSSK